MRNQPWSPADFTALLEDILDRTGMTQAELAGLVPIDPSQVTRWKTGTARPNYDRLRALGIALRERHPSLRIGEVELLTSAGYDAPQAVPAIRERPPPTAAEGVTYPDWVTGDRFLEHIYNFADAGIDEVTLTKEKLIAARAVVTHREAMSGTHRAIGQRRA